MSRSSMFSSATRAWCWCRAWCCCCCRCPSRCCSLCTARRHPADGPGGTRRSPPLPCHPASDVGLLSRCKPRRPFHGWRVSGRPRRPLCGRPRSAAYRTCGEARRLCGEPCSCCPHGSASDGAALALMMCGKCLALAVQSTTCSPLMPTFTCAPVTVATVRLECTASKPTMDTVASGTVPHGTSHSAAVSGALSAISGAAGPTVTAGGAGEAAFWPAPPPAPDFDSSLEELLSPLPLSRPWLGLWALESDAESDLSAHHR